MILRLACLFFFLGCGHPAPPDPSPPSSIETLRTKVDIWQAYLKTISDPATGWPSLTDCDGTLWAGEAVAAGASIHLELAEWAPGEIHRRPKTSGECYPTGSRSTISNDALTGYMLGLWRWAYRDGLQRLATFGELNQWQMGDPKNATEVYFSPSGQGLLGRAIQALGGPSKPYRDIPEPCLPVFKDYEFHLQTLGILLDGEVSGKISDLCFLALKANAAKFHGDALIQAAVGRYTGNFDGALNLLTASDYACPSYVRPEPSYCLIHKLYAAKVVLQSLGGLK